MPQAGHILIVAVNARYSHASHSARCLMAALGDLAPRAVMLEADLEVQPFQLAGTILEHAPSGVAFSVYLWNAAIVFNVIQMLRQVAPGLPILVGGPEIVAEDERCHGLAEMVVGEGEAAFAAWAERVLGGRAGEARSPYDFYDSTDIGQRTVYVESSRGCPFGCAYCTSCRTRLRLFPIDQLAADFDALMARGIRAFRFLDRSFNADEAHACRVLDYFLQRNPGRFPIHLEIIPRPFGDALRERLCAFPDGVLHIEVGVQTLNPQTASTIGRDIPVDDVLNALAFLKNDARASVHADLIFGLPGESVESFAAGFDRLVREIAPPELQVNLLKLLPGTPLRRDAGALHLQYNAEPPYELLSSDAMSFAEITRLQRFARCWELVHNRGRFPEACAALLATPSPFAGFQALADFIHAREGRLHAIHARRWQEHMEEFLR